MYDCDCTLYNICRSLTTDKLFDSLFWNSVIKGYKDIKLCLFEDLLLTLLCILLFHTVSRYPGIVTEIKLKCHYLLTLRFVLFVEHCSIC